MKIHPLHFSLEAHGTRFKLFYSGHMKRRHSSVETALMLGKDRKTKRDKERQDKTTKWDGVSCSGSGYTLGCSEIGADQHGENPCVIARN